MARHLLYLTNDRLQAWQQQGNELVKPVSFTLDQSGNDGLRRYLMQHRNAPVALFVDLLEEDFRQDAIPHLNARDSAAVQIRRLGQIYRNTPFRHALIQGRETEGRKNDMVLYHAITNPDLLKPWLEILVQAQTPLVGIYSAPVVSGNLLEALNMASSHALLVTMLPDGGLRQSYFQGKQLKFSRLTQLMHDTPASISKQIAAETARIWQYLESLRFFTTEDRLEVAILVPQADQAHIAEEMKAFPFMRHRLLGDIDIAKALKVKAVSNSWYSGETLLQCCAQVRLRNHYASAEDMRYGTYRQARIGLYGFTLAALCAGLLGATYLLQQAGKVGDEMDLRARIVRQKQGEYQQLSSQLQQQALNSETVRDTALFHVNQMRPVPAPGPLLRTVSRIWSTFPDMSLQQVVWETGSNPERTPAYTPITTRQSASVQSEIRVEPGSAAANVNVAANQASSQTNPSYQGNKVQIAIIEGELTPFDGNYRAALARVEALVKALNAAPSLKVRALTLPLDTQSNTMIKTNSLKATETGRTSFVLRIQYDPLSVHAAGGQP